ncbi:hypothetical protein BHE74_00057654 [Ensete ventricosum]|nr:hypothetical protein BHE74_00057654 [Ensete ventricosum]RZS26947.1 hypothetical protein BHM03_00060370 [Ensete ventricosum]
MHCNINQLSFIRILVEPLLYLGEGNCSSYGTGLPRLNRPFYLRLESLDEDNRLVIEGFSYNGFLFWATVFGGVRVMKIGYDGCVLRLEGCPKGVLGGGSEMVEFRWVKKKKKDKDVVADFSSKKFQQ